jgi:hypothetical protein
MKTIALRLSSFPVPTRLGALHHKRYASPWLIAFFAALFLAVVYIWFDQGILGIWSAFEAGSVSATFAALVSAFMVFICAAHAALFILAYRWLVE